MAPLKWLQWSSANLARGLGGVEVHARCLHAELRKRGVESVIAGSDDAAVFASRDWDIVHLHGSSVNAEIFSALKRRPQSTRVLMTLHGTTLGRMWSCREFAWLGGYLGAERELKGLLAADLIASVTPGLHLETLARRLNKRSGLVLNGWDSGMVDPLADQKAELPAQLLDALGTLGQTPFAYVGRGGDPVKGADRLAQAAILTPDLRFVAAPGEGFEGVPQIVKTGRLSTAQVGALLERSRGLVIPSRYEGNPLVALEALARGVPVVATRVGYLQHMPEGVEGLVLVPTGDPRALADGLRGAMGLAQDPESRESRSRKNRSLLPTWKKVAHAYLELVGYRQGQSP